MSLTPIPWVAFEKKLMIRLWVDADQLVLETMQLLADIKQVFDRHSLEFAAPRLDSGASIICMDPRGMLVILLALDGRRLITENRFTE